MVFSLVCYGIDSISCSSLYMCVTGAKIAWRYFLFFFFKQKTAYEMRISDWSSDVCSSDLLFDMVENNTDAGTALSTVQDGLVQYATEQGFTELGRASCRERVCQYV